MDTTKACPDIPDDLSTLPLNPGELVNCNNPNSPSSKKHKRQSGGGGSCPLAPGGSGAEKSIDYKPGPTPSPTCAAGASNCGGRLCTGFYCRPNLTGIPPDHMDPKDPNAGNPVPTTKIPGPSSSRTTSTTSRSTSATPTAACDDKCKLDKGNPCVCSDTGCDEQSPACCHMRAVPSASAAATTGARLDRRRAARAAPASGRIPAAAAG